MIVVDASALIEILLQTPAVEAVEERLFRNGETLRAPHLLDVEAAQGEIDEDRGRAALDDLSDLPLRRYPHSFLLARIWEFWNNFTAYDAAYVALAEALDAPLLTRDRRLAAATDSYARIELV